MKRFITLIVCFILAQFTMSAQDKFYSYGDMAGKRVILYNQMEILNKYEPYVYQYNNKNKLKAIKNPDFYEHLDKSIVYVVGLETHGKRKYIHLTKDEEDYYVIIDGRLEFLNNVRPTNIEQFVEITNKYSYLDLTSTTATQSSYITRQAGIRFPILERYLPIYWEPYSIPETIDDDFIISFKLDERGPGIPLTYSQCTSYNGFITQEELDKKIEKYEEAKRIQEIQDSIDVHTVVEAKLINLKAAEDKLDTYKISNFLTKGDIIYVSIYGYDSKSDHYYCILEGKEVIFPSYMLTFSDSETEEFSVKRGMYSTEKRKEVAKVNDKKRSEERAPKVDAYFNHLKEALKNYSQFISQKKLFIKNTELLYSGYNDVGIKVEIFNCFSKPIKYVELKVAAYNVVDDRVGEPRNIRCIGYIYQNESGIYSFEDVFYDRNGIIGKLQIINAKITFKDNTVVSYSGKDSVKAHMYGHYITELLNILEN